MNCETPFYRLRHDYSTTTISADLIVPSPAVYITRHYTPADFGSRPVGFSIAANTLSINFPYILTREYIYIYILRVYGIYLHQPLPLHSSPSEYVYVD